MSEMEWLAFARAVLDSVLPSDADRALALERFQGMREYRMAHSQFVEGGEGVNPRRLIMQAVRKMYTGEDN